MLDQFGFDLQVRAFELAKVFFPEMFDEDGEYRNYDVRFSHCETQLTQKITRVLEAKIKRHPESYMLYDWKEILPEIVRRIQRENNPQMELF